MATITIEDDGGVHMPDRLSLVYQGQEVGYLYPVNGGIVIVGLDDVTIQGQVYVPNGTVRARHAAYDGSAKADTQFSFKDGDGRTHTVTFRDGLVVSWAKR